MQQIEGQTTEVGKMRLFLKVSVVYPRHKSLGNESELWSVFLPLSTQKLMNEIIEGSQRLVNIIWQGYEKTGSVTPVSKDRKVEKKILRLVNVVMPGLPSKIVRSCDQCGCLLPAQVSIP